MYSKAHRSIRPNIWGYWNSGWNSENLGERCSLKSTSTAAQVGLQHLSEISNAQPHTHTHTPSPLPQTKRVGQHLWRWKQTHSLSLSSETLRQLQPCPWWRLWISRIVWRSWARSSNLFLGNCTRKCLEIITTINALINRHWPDNRACH